MEDNGKCRNWSDFMTGFLLGSIDAAFPGTAKSVESCIDEDYFIVLFGEKKTRLKISVHAEVIEEGE